MEKSLKELIPDQNLRKVEVSENSDELQLSEDEVKKALAVALNEKRAKIEQRDYWKKVNNPAPVAQFTSEQFISWCIKRYEKNYESRFNVDSGNESIIELLSWYFTRDDRFTTAGYSFAKGIMLYGPVGCGKTSIFKLFACNPVQSFVLYSARKVASDYSKFGGEAIDQYSGYIQPIISTDYFKHRSFGICFDDLGTEEIKKNFGNESNVMAEILLNRYDSQLSMKNKTHVTTNLNADQIEQMYGSRVRSRSREMFNIILFNDEAPDRRK
jgi:hypothetical protein